MFKKFKYPITAENISQVVDECITSFNCGGYEFFNKNFGDAFNKIEYCLHVAFDDNKNILIGVDSDSETDYFLCELDLSCVPTYEERINGNYSNDIEKYNSLEFTQWINEWHEELENSEDINCKEFKALCETFATEINNCFWFLK